MRGPEQSAFLSWLENNIGSIRQHPREMEGILIGDLFTLQRRVPGYNASKDLINLTAPAILPPGIYQFVRCGGFGVIIENPNSLKERLVSWTEQAVLVRRQIRANPIKFVWYGFID